ncbi:Rcs stress response system protein RcsF [Colwelliaceae bacterium BS250]
MTNISKNYLINRTVPVLLLLLCSSCSSNVDTNLDKENFEEYFSVGSVHVFENEDEFTGASHFVGLVEGEDCRVKENGIPANAREARTDAREKAAALNANAVVFTSCTLIEDPQCLEVMVCYGKAYQVVSDD